MRKKLRLFRETVRVLTPTESKQAFAAGTEGNGTICGQCVDIRQKTDPGGEDVQTLGEHTCNQLECGGGGTVLYPCTAITCTEYGSDVRGCGDWTC